MISAYPQGHFEQPPQVQTSGAPMGGQPVMPLPPGGQPAGYAPAPFLVPPPQFIPPQTAPPSIINYVSGPNGPPFQPNFQGYQGYNPTVPVRFGFSNSLYLKEKAFQTIHNLFLSFVTAPGSAAPTGVIPTSRMHLLQPSAAATTATAGSPHAATKGSNSNSTTARQ